MPFALHLSPLTLILRICAENGALGQVSSTMSLLYYISRVHICRLTVPVPHGGYTNAILYRVATNHLTRNHPSRFKIPPIPVSIQLSFVRRTRVGFATVSVQDIKLGARMSTINVTLSQERQPKPGESAKDNLPLEEKIVGYITLSPADFDDKKSISKSNWTLHPPPASGSKPGGGVDLAALAATGCDGEWLRYKETPFIAASNHIELFGPKSHGPPDAIRNQEIEQWARFRPGGQTTTARWTNEALMYLLDVLPRGLDKIGALEMASRGLQPSDGDRDEYGYRNRFWFPTVTMNIDLKQSLPLEGVEWLYSRVVTKTVQGGRSDLDIVILDENGELVALSTQVGLVVGADRNLGPHSTIKGAEGKL